MAAQLGMGLEILSAVSGVPVEELAKQMDALLTDSTEHCKGVNVILMEMFELDKPAGQLFCGSHTVLGFSSAMNAVVLRLELSMGLDKLLSTFMCSMELDSKNGSLAGQSLDMMLRLVCPEFKHKSWNYYGLFTQYLKERGVALVLFAYKDHRFGCLSRAAAVLLYNYEHLKGFLSANPSISNKLACLVRELLLLPHLKVIFAAFAVLGIYVIEPFFSRTIAKGACHSELKIFYKELHTGLLETKVDSSILSFDHSLFPGISEQLFNAVKESYGKSVVEVVGEVGMEQPEDLVLLINHILPQLASTLAKQRRDYGIDPENYPSQYPVEEQAANVDDTPINNLDMERLMGMTDQRVKKLRTLNATSRSIILKKTEHLRKASENPDFRSFKKQVEIKRDKEVEWNAKMADKLKNDAARKQEVALGQERKRIIMLEDLKGLGGPFTSQEEVEEFLGKSIPEKEKVARMKKEMKFARDSSTTLPRVDPLFKIQVGKVILSFQQVINYSGDTARQEKERQDKRRIWRGFGSVPWEEG